MPILRRALILAVLVLALAAAQLAGAERPNVLVLCADDLGLQLGCYGDRTVPTPNIDALAARGTRFRNAYVVQPSCSPSRSCGYTGLWPHQNGMFGLAQYGWQLNQGVEPGINRVRRAGFHTGILGKLHVEPRDRFDVDVMSLGTEVTRQQSWVRKEVNKFLARQKGKPFVMWLNYFDAHRKVQGWPGVVEGLPEQELDPAKITPWSWCEPKQGQDDAAYRKDIAQYYDCIARLDTLVGITLAELERTGQLDDTVVIFWGDNGPPFARAKATAYENGSRTPFIMAGPGIEAGQVRDELVSTVDLAPTVEALAGAPVPEALAARRTGRDLMPLCRGETPPWREYLFTELTFHQITYYRPSRAVRGARYKLIENLHPLKDQPAVELYDLEEDPDERKNLANDPARAGDRARLAAALEEWREQTGDPLLDPAVVEALATIPADPEKPLPPWFPEPRKRRRPKAGKR